MLRIAICDDQAEARAALAASVDRLLEASGPEGMIYEFSGGEGLLRWQASHAGELDLVFLDIGMRGIDGMETARRLRAADGRLMLVFVTGYADYVFDGYEVGALGYLLKPADPARLAVLLERAENRLRSEEPDCFLCKNADGLYRFPKREILYFASDRRKVSCVTAARTVEFYGKLDEVAARAGPAFVRIHQRYLVRAAAVERIAGSTLYVGAAALPISRACRGEALAAVTRQLLAGEG